MAKINFSETLTLASDKVSRNIYLQSISQGCMSMLPVVIIGSFALSLIHISEPTRRS